jgi:hypothetical protein
MSEIGQNKIEIIENSKKDMYMRASACLPFLIQIIITQLETKKESVCCWCRRRLTAALLHLANDAQFASVTFQIDLQHRLISCSTPHHLHLSPT